VDSNSLIGKALERVWLFPAAPVHPAWVDEFTTPINTWEAFLEFSDGELASLSPCEVNLSEDRYPSLGLAIEVTTPAAMTMTYSGGRVVGAVPLEEAAEFLPAPITFVEPSDPLGEDTATQYTIGGSGWLIIFRHIFPPMTLGICVERR
jgi:hypothetical protein